MNRQDFLAAAKRLLGRCRRPPLYWLRLLAIVMIVQYAVTWIDERGIGASWKNQFYAWLQKTNPHKPADRNTLLVLIGDDEFWRGDLQYRAPVKRCYLAELLSRLVAANAKVVAFDFDLRSPSPDGKPRESPDYVSETDYFLQTVKSLAKHGHAVVLSRPVWQQDDGDYALESSSYDDFAFGSAKASGSKENRAATVNLP